MKALERRIFCVVIGLTAPINLWAFNHYGRIAVGGFLSQETHEPEPYSTERNDFATVSQRYFYQATDLWDSPIEFVTDFRDKHDFFDKLDKERQILTSKNTFQLRQTYLRKDSGRRGFIWQAGRFWVPEAGSSFVDGGELGYRFNSTWQGGIFGGYNPKQLDEDYLEFNKDAQTYGLFVEASPKTNSWRRRLFSSSALVFQNAFSEIDRQYFFNHTIYQWDIGGYFSSLLYLDFVPRTYIQNGFFTFSENLGRKWNARLSYLVIDVIEYRRRQALRERLEPSPYSEVQARATYSPSNTTRVIFSTRHGQRQADSQRRESYRATLSLPRYFSSRTDTSISLENKKEFTSDGNFVSLGQAYFTNRWEVDFALDWGREKQTDGTYLTPLIAESTCSFLTSKQLYSAISFQYAKDEKVEIKTFWFMITYRFGNKGVAPIRDGAPPRGRLW